MEEILIGTTFELSEKVTDLDSASRVGSGALDVYSTPSMIALMEKTSMMSIESFLDVSETTVGGSVNIKHYRPTSIGKEVHCKSEVARVKGKKIDFNVEVYEAGILIGDGQHTRFVVDKKAFLMLI